NKNQPWRALLTIINLCLTRKTSGFERPRAPTLQILWGIVKQANIDYAERIWEEFVLSIHTFVKDKWNLSWHKTGKKKATLIMIPSIRFTKLIIHHLQRRHKFYPRPDSPLHLPNEEPFLGYLKFGAKGTKIKVFGMPILGSLTAADIQAASYYQEYLASMAKYRRGPLLPVVIREPESEKYQPLLEVPGKDKAKVTEEQAGPDPGNTGADVHSIPSLVVHAGSDCEHMDLDVAGVLLEEPASSSGTLSSLQHLSKDISFGDLFFSDKPSDADKNEKTKVESMVNVPIQQELSSISLMTSSIIDLTSRPEYPKMEERLDKHGARLYMLEQLDIPQQVSKAIYEVVTDAVDWAMQAPLRNRFRDLLEADMKEILHQRMWETESYKSHEDHMQLFEALEKSMNRDHAEELARDLAEARMKKKKRRESPKTPPGSPPHSPPPPPPPAGPSRASRDPRASGSSQVPPPPPPPSSTNQENLEMDEDMGPDEQAQLSDDEDIGSAHILKVNLRKDWWKPFEEERPATLEPAWSIRSSNTGDIATFIDWFYKRRGITELKPQDLEGPAFEIVKYLYPIDFEDMYLLNLQGHLNHLPPKDKKILTTAVNQWTRHLIIQQCVEDFQLGIKSYQTQLNLTKSRWDATGFEYKHDYTVIDSPRAVMFQDKYEVRMMMCFNEIHKFSDGTLQQIDEALYYRVKEFRINRTNPEAFEDKADLLQPGELCWWTRQRGRLQTFEAYQMIKSFRHSRPLSDDFVMDPVTYNFNPLATQVCSSLRSLKPKRTIKSRAKRSSKNNLIRTLFQYACFFTHCENEDGNPARANIKQALANELTNAFGKPFEEGLSARITHGAEGRQLADVAAYNPSAKADYLSALQHLQNVNFSLIAELKSNKDATDGSYPHSSDQRVVGASALSLSLEVSHSRVKKMRENIAKHVSALRGVFVTLSAAALKGMKGTSGSTHDATTTLSTTFVSTSTIPPISINDYEVAHANGQGGAGVDDETAAIDDMNLYVSNAELNISE
nr:hypothetical protein [Tanacetum cinerariifolium]